MSRMISQDAEDRRERRLTDDVALAPSIAPRYSGYRGYNEVKAAPGAGGRCF